MLLEGKHIKLRALEPEDLEFLYQIENNTNNWIVSHTQVPFSKFLLKQYLENAHQDIYEAKQLRLIIQEKESDVALGMVDLFDFNPQHKRAGVGIVVHDDFYRFGFASKALNLLIEYSFTHLNLHQLYANITPDNKASIALFTKCGFTKTGEKKDWIFANGSFKNELTYQLIHE